MFFNLPLPASVTWVNFWNLLLVTWVAYLVGGAPNWNAEHLATMQLSVHKVMVDDMQMRTLR